MRRLVRALVPYGARRAGRHFLAELKIAALDRRGRLRARQWKDRDSLRVHIGCGPRVKPGWLNIDLHPAADLRVDLRERLPLADESAVIVYAEHFLEHVDYPEPVRSVLRDYLRILEPGGLLRLAVPDMELVLRAYVNGGDEAFYEAQQRWNPPELRTQMEHVNFNFRQWNEHRFGYDFETLRVLLTDCGFVDIERSLFDSELDSVERVTGSLYVTARRPSNGQALAYQRSEHQLAT
jgi:predicted SAM-dependent methyltransferase